MPHIDPYPEPVPLTAVQSKRVQQLQSEQGRETRLRRLARRNRDVAWLLAEHARASSAAPAPKKPKSKANP
ncbi:MAG: hypothetical protein M5U12_17100 [Verrucomicrobia bacterium]|nr:hypothetical protein [Verrucomicrobiota bacterium]